MRSWTAVCHSFHLLPKGESNPAAHELLQLRMARINIDRSQKLALLLGVKVIPTFMYWPAHTSGQSPRKRALRVDTHILQVTTSARLKGLRWQHGLRRGLRSLKPTNQITWT